MKQGTSKLDLLREEILHGHLTRRDVLKRAMVMGLSAPVIASLLAACGGDDDDNEATKPAATATTAGGATTSPTSAGTSATATTGGGAAPTATTGGGSATTPTTGEASASPTTGGGTTEAIPGHGRGQADLLRILFWQAPTNLNPHLSQGDKDSLPSHLVLEPLLAIDQNSGLKAVLAAEVPSLENGGLAADGMSVTYKLKQGVTWSDGEPFTANDIKFTWQLVTDKTAAATTFAAYDVIQDVEVVDDTTVTLKFKQPNPQWFGPFSTGYGGQVMPMHILQDFMGDKLATADFNLKPIGTGPYKVDEFRPGDVINYSINDSFREADKPYFTKIEWKGGGDATASARAVLQSGETDFGWNLQVEKEVLDQLSSSSDIGELFISPGPSDEQILLNFADPNTEVDGAKSEPSTQHPYLSDKNVRMAFAMGCDRDTIATQLYGPAGEATANLLVVPQAFVSPNTSYTFDIDAAGKLLDGAGWVLDGDTRKKDGKEMSALYQTTVNPVRQKTQEIVKASWEKMGVKVELKSIDAGVYFSSDAGNPDTAGHFYADFEMFTTGPSSPYPIDWMNSFKSDKPETDLAQKSNGWVGTNYNRWVNDDYNKLWLEAQVELDPAKQAPLFIAMNDLIVNEVVRIALVHRASVDGIAKKLKGHQGSPFDTNVWDLAEWYFEE